MKTSSLKRLAATALALVLTLGFVAGTTGPASAEVKVPEFVKDMFGKGTKAAPKTVTPYGACWGTVSATKVGRMPALAGGPIVDGIVAKGGIVCIGWPAENIVTTTTISREHSIVTKFRRCAPPMPMWEYHCLSLAMRGPYFIMPDTYWATSQTTYTQQGIRKTTPLVVSGRTFHNTSVYS